MTPQVANPTQDASRQGGNAQSQKLHNMLSPAQRSALNTVRNFLLQDPEGLNHVEVGNG